MAELPIRRVNKYWANSYRSSVHHEGMTFSLPTGPNSKYGPAVRGRRIIAEIAPKKIYFFERTLMGNEVPIGSLALGPLRASGRKSFYLADLVPAFALEDIPVNHYQVEYNRVLILFSHNERNLYFADFAAGRIFLRAGYSDRLEVVKKMPDSEAVIAQIPKSLLPQAGPPGSKKKSFRAYEAIEELGARRVPFNLSRFPEHVVLYVFGVTFSIPVRDGNVYREAIGSGRLVPVAYSNRVVFKMEADGGDREVGQLDFSGGFLRGPDGKPWHHQGQPVKKDVHLKTPINIEPLVPEFGRLEKHFAPALEGRLSYRRTFYSFRCLEGDPYYSSFQAGMVVFRGIGRRMELFTAWPGCAPEYLGDFGFDADRKLLTQDGNVYRTEKGPLTEGDPRQVDVARLIGALRPENDWREKLFLLLKEKDHDELSGQFAVPGAGRGLLKLFTRLGSEYLSNPAADAQMAARIISALRSGLEQLVRPNQISADLKQAFAGEVIRTMNLALSNPALTRIREVLSEQLQQASDLMGIAAKARANGAEALPHVKDDKPREPSLEKALFSRAPRGQEEHFLSEGRYLEWIGKLTMFGRSYFLGEGEGESAAEWSLREVADYYSLMYKAISLLNNSPGFENDWALACGVKERDALVVAAAAVLVEMEHRPQVDSFYFKVLTRKGAALSATLKFDQKVQLVKLEANLLVALRPESDKLASSAA
jgi:hypothetical protein